MVLHKLVKGLDNVKVGEIFACGSIYCVQIYLWICHALADKDELIKNYISIPSSARLANIFSKLS